MELVRGVENQPESTVLFCQVSQPSPIRPPDWEEAEAMGYLLPSSLVGIPRWQLNLVPRGKGPFAFSSSKGCVSQVISKTGKGCQRVKKVRGRQLCG